MISAAEILEDEFRLQAARIEDLLVTHPDHRHFLELRDSYREAAATTRTLRRYHEARLERLTRTGTTAPSSDDARPRAYMDDED